MIKLTEAEKNILRNLPRSFKWIVRDEHEDIKVYQEKPFKEGILWKSENIWCYEYLNIFNHLFRFIKWSDEEPYLIEDLLERGD